MAHMHVSVMAKPTVIASHIFDTLGATWWIDAAEEPQDRTTQPQWALNRGSTSVPHARLGSSGRAELRGSYGLVLPGVSGNYASAPDSAALDGFATLDLVAQIAMDDWTPSSPQYVITKYGSTTRSYIFGFNTGGVLRCLVSEDGTATMGGDSTVATAFTDGQIGWIRVLVTPGVTNGTMKFYTSTDGATWTQLGSDVSAAGYNTQLANSSDPLNIGGHTNGTTQLMVGRVFRAQVWNGDSTSGGTKVFDADFTAPAAFATSFTESSANAATVTINATSGADTNDPLLLPHTGTNYLYLPGVAGNTASTPDAAALDITGDLEIVMRVALDDWTPSARNGLLSKMPAASTTGYAVEVETTGSIKLIVGDGTSRINASSVPAFTDGSAYWLKITYDADNGASNSVTRFFYAADQATEPSSWTQIGSDVNGTVCLPSNVSDSLVLGVRGGVNPATGKFFRTIVRNGIGGTAVFDADFTANTNQSSFTESSSNAATVTINRASSGRKSVMVTRPVWLFGTDDYMEVADNDLLDMAAADSFTVVMIRRQWGTTPSYGTLVSKTAGGTADGWSLFNNISATSHSFSIADGAAQTYLAGAGCPAYTYGALELAAGVRNVGADTITAYVGTTGGTPATDTTTSDLSSSGPMRIGRVAAGATPYYGEYEVVAVAVFRSALDSTALASIASYFGV